eukprot:2436561-Rhodomonas_salina.2
MYSNAQCNKTVARYSRGIESDLLPHRKDLAELSQTLHLLPLLPVLLLAAQTCLGQYRTSHSKRVGQYSSIVPAARPGAPSSVLALQHNLIQPNSTLLRSQLPAVGSLWQFVPT